MSLATIEDVATDLGRPIEVDSAEARQVQQWIDRVEGRIARRVAGYASLIVTDPSYREVVIGVVVAVVARRARNPDGKSYERIDDYGYGLGASGPSDLALTDAEWGDLLPGGSVGAFTVRPVGRPDRVVPPW